MSAETIIPEKKILGTVADWERRARSAAHFAAQEVKQSNRSKRFRAEERIYREGARQIRQTLVVAEAQWNDESKENQMLTALELAFGRGPLPNN